MRVAACTIPSIDFSDFKEYLLLFSRDVAEELDEFVWEEGPSQVSEWLVSIFEEWVDIAKPLSHKHQNTLVWRIGGYPLFIGFWLRDDSKLDFAHKLALLNAAKCVSLSVPLLFGPEEPMENGYYMWWHLLSKGITNPQVASTCLEILGDLSRHQDLRVQFAALHGLGHLKHPERPAIIDDYLRRHPEFKGDRWILECREGTVM